MNLILLDSCSICSIFVSRDFHRNIGHYSFKGYDAVITILSNGGRLSCSQVGYLPDLSFPVWHHSSSIANIASLAEMVRESRITMDSDVENTFPQWLDHAGYGMRGMLFHVLFCYKKVLFYVEQGITHPIQGLYTNASKCSLSQ